MHSSATDEATFASFATKNTSMVTKNTDTRNNVTCSMCSKEREHCSCLQCFYCGDSFTSPINHNLILGRHFCRHCERPCCSNCRDENKNRWHPRFNNQKEKVRYCKRCAPLKALGSVLVNELHHNSCNNASDQVWQSKPRRGLLLLFESMDAPRRCLDVESCGAMTDEDQCPSCQLPTVTLKPFVEKLSTYRPLPESPLHQRCLEAEMKVDRLLEERFAPENKEKLQTLEEDVFDREFWSPPEELPAHEYRDVLLTCIAASVCYEYNHFPRMMLNSTDAAAAKLLRPIEVHASFTIFEASGDRIIIAFPGTHNAATIAVDLNASRTFVTETTTLNNGLSASSIINNNDDAAPTTTKVNGGVQTLHHYRVHNGFLRASTLLEHRLPTSRILKFIREGKRVVFSGHSLGSSLSSLTCLRVLRQHPELAHQTVERKIRDPHNKGKMITVKVPVLQCIDFAPPLVGNTALKNRIHRAGLAKLFLHVVYRADIVPRFLTVGRAHEEMVNSMKAKVEEVTSKIAAAGNSFVGKVRSFFGGDAKKKEEEEKQLKLKQEEDAKKKQQSAAAAAAAAKELEGKSPGKKNYISPNSSSPTYRDTEGSPSLLTSRSSFNNNSNGSSSSSTSIQLQPSREQYLSSLGISEGASDLFKASSTTVFSKHHQHDHHLTDEQKRKSTLQIVRDLDLDNEDVHVVAAASNMDLAEMDGGGFENSSAAAASGHKKTNSLSIHAVSAPTTVVVQSPYDTFGRYLFLAPTAEAFQVTTPKATPMNSTDHFSSAGTLADHELFSSAMRTRTMLVQDPAESFGVLRNTSGSWMTGINDHFLDGYQRSLMMACYKG